MITETIYGQVVAKANHYQAVADGHGGRRIIKDQALREYERQFDRQCRLYRGQRIAEPFLLTIDVWHKSVRYDLDNSLKTVLDCLQYADAITDDNLCYSIRATKHVDKMRPRIRYSITPINHQMTFYRMTDERQTKFG